MVTKENAFERFWVQFLLRVGLGMAILLMLVGALMKVSSGSIPAPAVSLFELTSRTIAPADRVMAWGVLVLALTPAFRVLLLLTIWLRQKDWKFSLVAGVVLFTLLISIAMGQK